jgi:rRNA biogenesis protein RRP5
VQSIEDHGYLMDLGLSGVRGFMPFTEESVENSASNSSLLQPVGSVRLVTVNERSDNGRTYRLSQTDQDIRQSIVGLNIVTSAFLPELNA